MIHRFDIVPNSLAAGRDHKPYLVCLQHHRLDHLQTQIPAPLLSGNASKEEPRLNPGFRIGSITVYLDPTDLVTLPVRRFDKTIVNLEAQRDKIIAALYPVSIGI
jgi:hypothetical protein